MAFGQVAGPPATHKQLDELLDLLMKAGFDSFKEARYPMDFTQRQAGGKFTRDEAEGFIATMRERSEIEDASIAPVRSFQKASTLKAQTSTEQSPASKALSEYPADELAAELQRRGWIVAEP